MAALVFVPALGTDGLAFSWGGFVAIALSVLAIQSALARPVWLDGRVLVWIGKVSYGLYLWHCVFVRSDIPTWAALALTVVTAAASWYLVEDPIRRWRGRLRSPTSPLEPLPPGAALEPTGP